MYKLYPLSKLELNVLYKYLKKNIFMLINVIIYDNYYSDRGVNKNHLPEVSPACPSFPFEVDFCVVDPFEELVSLVPIIFLRHIVNITTLNVYVCNTF